MKSLSWLLLVILIGGGVGWGAQSVLDTIGEYRSRPERVLLTPGTMVPDVKIVSDGGEVGRLDALRSESRANVLVMLSATCSTCLGELAAWRDLRHEMGTDVRPLVLIETQDDSYLEYVSRLIEPNYEIFRVDSTVMDTLGVAVTPVTYLLSDDGVVLESKIGVEAIELIREDFRSNLNDPVS